MLHENLAVTIYPTWEEIWINYIVKEKLPTLENLWINKVVHSVDGQNCSPRDIMVHPPWHPLSKPLLLLQKASSYLPNALHLLGQASFHPCVEEHQNKTHSFCIFEPARLQIFPPRHYPTILTDLTFILSKEIPSNMEESACYKLLKLPPPITLLTA